MESQSPDKNNKKEIEKSKKFIRKVAGSNNQDGEFNMPDQKEIFAHQHNKRHRNFNKKNKVFNASDQKMKELGEQEKS